MSLTDGWLERTTFRGEPFFILKNIDLKKYFTARITIQSATN